MRSCHLYAFFAILTWSTAYVGTKVIATTFAPGALGLLRCACATIVLLAFATMGKLQPPKARDIPFFVMSGACGMALYIIFFTRGLVDIGATTASVIIGSSPIMAALLARFLLGERLSPLGWLAIGLAFCGILVLTLWDGSLNVNSGVVWIVLAALVFALYSILQRKLSRDHDSISITVYSFIAATLLLSPYLPLLLAQIRQAPPVHTIIALFLGVFPSAVAYLLWVKALAIAPKTSYVTNYSFLLPIASLILELAILRQWPDAGAILGGIIIMGSLALFVFAGKKKSA